MEVHRVQNDDYPPQNPRDPPLFAEPTLEFCVLTTQNICEDGKIRLTDGVLEKTEHTTLFSRAAGYDDDDNCIISSESSQDSGIEDANERAHQAEDKVNLTAYLIGTNIADAIYGRVYSGRVLRRTSAADPWQVAVEGCVINNTENPENEIAAMNVRRSSPPPSSHHRRTP